MRTNLYFSFIGSAFGRHCPLHENETRNVMAGKWIHGVSLANYRMIDVYKHRNPNLVWVCEKTYILEQWWSDGTRTGGYTEASWYLCQRQSFDCLPAVPVSTYGKSLSEALLA